MLTFKTPAVISLMEQCIWDTDLYKMADRTGSRGLTPRSESEEYGNTDLDPSSIIDSYPCVVWSSGKFPASTFVLLSHSHTVTNCILWNSFQIPFNRWESKKCSIVESDDKIKIVLLYAHKCLQIIKKCWWKELDQPVHPWDFAWRCW